MFKSGLHAEMQNAVFLSEDLQQKWDSHKLQYLALLIPPRHLKIHTPEIVVVVTTQQAHTKKYWELPAVAAYRQPVGNAIGCLWEICHANFEWPTPYME